MKRSCELLNSNYLRINNWERKIILLAIKSNFVDRL